MLQQNTAVSKLASRTVHPNAAVARQADRGTRPRGAISPSTIRLDGGAVPTFHRRRPATTAESQSTDDDAANIALVAGRANAEPTLNTLGPGDLIGSQ